MSPRLLAVVAVAAQALHQVFLLLPMAMIIGLGVAWYPHPVYVTVGVIGFLLLAWLFQPDVRDDVIPLPREQAPQLYADVDRLADEMQAPRVHCIALDETFNAGALEQNRGISLRRTRRVLILGRPLLQSLDPDAVLAVIAHELGHFSRQHGRSGHWLYRTRLSWERWQFHVDDGDSSAWERAAGAFASAFVPWFKRASFADSRRCEFEADAAAARACGPAAVGRALALIDQIQRCIEIADESALLDLRRQFPELPRDLLARREAAWRAVPSIDVVPTEPADATHPPTADRLAALQVLPQAWACPERPAFAYWLPTGDAEPARAEQIEWAMWHALLAGLKPPTDGPLDEGAAGDLERAQECFETGRLAEARDLWRARAATTEPRTALRDAACRLLARHAWTLGLDEAERAPFEERLVGIGQRRHEALNKLEHALDRGDVGPAQDWPEAKCAALRSSLRQHPAVRDVFLGARDIEMPGDWRYPGLALWIRIDPIAMDLLGQHQDEVAEACAPLLRHCAGVGSLCMVRSSYTTEGLPPLFEARSASLRLP